MPRWGSGAYKEADGHNRDHPDCENRQVNALGWMDIHKRFDFKSVIITAWSRYSVSRIQVDPIEGAPDTMINLVVILHDGKAVPHEVASEAICAAVEDAKRRESRVRHQCLESVNGNMGAIRTRPRSSRKRWAAECSSTVSLLHEESFPAFGR